MAKIGIDLGTSNTLVARIVGEGNNRRPEICQIDGLPSVPSCIFLEKKALNSVVGQSAIELWASDQTDGGISFLSWKTYIGESKTLSVMGGTKITPELLTTKMVEYVLRRLCEGLGGLDIDSVLITVPHGWRKGTPEKCKQTQQAASQALLNNQPVSVTDTVVSEPVAAAAYWIWEHQAKYGAAELANKDILVCDIGGGTFDMSLIRIGSDRCYLDVLDAMNDNIAGDYADRLICGWVMQQFNEKNGTSWHTSPEDISGALTSGEMPWLRKWFLTCRNMKEVLSTRVRATSGLDMTCQPKSATFSVGNDNSMDAKINLETMSQILTPFYTHSRDSIRTFLNGRLPYAVLFSGGGSKILGIAEHIVHPVLTELSDGVTATAIMERISVNYEKADQAIALGAALVANEMVEVQERLLHDVGVVVTIHDLLAKALKLQTDRILLTPVLAKGSIIPAKFCSNKIKSVTTITPGNSTSVQIVMEDGITEPYPQDWKIVNGNLRESRTVEWSLEVDNYGVLRMTLGEDTVEGLSAPPSNVGVSVMKIVPVERNISDLPRVTIEELERALEQI